MRVVATTAATWSVLLCLAAINVRSVTSGDDVTEAPSGDIEVTTTRLHKSTFQEQPFWTTTESSDKDDTVTTAVPGARLAHADIRRVGPKDVVYQGSVATPEPTAPTSTEIVTSTSELIGNSENAAEDDEQKKREDAPQKVSFQVLKSANDAYRPAMQSGPAVVRRTEVMQETYRALPNDPAPTIVDSAFSPTLVEETGDTINDKSIASGGIHLPDQITDRVTQTGAAAITAITADKDANDNNDKANASRSSYLTYSDNGQHYAAAVETITATGKTPSSSKTPLSIGIAINSKQNQQHQKLSAIAVAAPTQEISNNGHSINGDQSVTDTPFPSAVAISVNSQQHHRHPEVASKSTQTATRQTAHDKKPTDESANISDIDKGNSFTSTEFPTRDRQTTGDSSSGLVASMAKTMATVFVSVNATNPVPAPDVVTTVRLTTDDLSGEASSSYTTTTIHDTGITTSSSKSSINGRNRTNAINSYPAISGTENNSTITATATTDEDDADKVRSSPSSCRSTAVTRDAAGGRGTAAVNPAAGVPAITPGRGNKTTSSAPLAEATLELRLNEVVAVAEHIINGNTTLSNSFVTRASNASYPTVTASNTAIVAAGTAESTLISAETAESKKIRRVKHEQQQQQQRRRQQEPITMQPLHGRHKQRLELRQPSEESDIGSSPMLNDGTSDATENFDDTPVEELPAMSMMALKAGPLVEFSYKEGTPKPPSRSEVREPAKPIGEITEDDQVQTADKDDT